MKDILYPTPLHYTRPSTISLCWRPFSFHPDRIEEEGMEMLIGLNNWVVTIIYKIGKKG